MPVKNNEIRSIDIDIQKSTEEEPLKLRGYAIVYNSLSEPLYGDLFRERINRGAFTKSLLELFCCMAPHIASQREIAAQFHLHSLKRKFAVRAAETRLL